MNITPRNCKVLKLTPEELAKWSSKASGKGPGEKPDPLLEAPAGTPKMLARQQAAFEQFGHIEWGPCGADGTGDGFLERCPGIHLHTEKNGPKDCIIYLKTVPTIKCQHTSCAAIVKMHNGQLRSRIHAAEAMLDTEVVPGIAQEPTEPTPTALDQNELGLLLDDLQSRLTNQTTFTTEHQGVVVTLWTAATHVERYFRIAPYLHIFSPTKECGKTNLLFMLRCACRSSLSAANLSTAYLYRVIQRDNPTLLVDQVEDFFANPESKSDIIGIFACYKRGMKVGRCGGANKDKLEQFETFCFKAFSGTVKMPEQIADRCIPIELRKRPRGKRFLEDLVELELKPLHDRLSAWAASDPGLKDWLPLDEWLPIAVSDRQAEIGEVLMRVARLAGPAWYAKARTALMNVFSGLASAEMSLTILNDIQEIWDDPEEEQLTAREIVDRLIDDDRVKFMWDKLLEVDKDGNYKASESLKGKWLDRRLDTFGLKTVRIQREPGVRHKYYFRPDFVKAWAVYCPKTEPTP